MTAGAAARVQARGFPVLAMEDLHRLEPSFEALPFAECVRRNCIPFRDGTNQTGLVFGNADTADFRTWATETLPGRFQLYLAQPDDIAACLKQHETSLKAMDSVHVAQAPVEADARADPEVSLVSIDDDSSEVVKLVHSTVYDAMRSGASDIHLRTSSGNLLIKYRLDGVLATVAALSSPMLADQVISRVKVMANLDITERRVPQDGRFRLAVQGRAVDFRVSIMPNSSGEDAVLRILDKRTLTDELRELRLDQLGFDPASIVSIRKLSNEPYGMFLVTGPTGSGKTTTLYAAISEINAGHDNIVTIEDPVEYELEGVLQIPVNDKKGLTFARGLRSILRHDPDRIMVGEIRDPETAQIAVQAALTGHLVFSTVHANNVFDVIGRFAHMGVERFAFTSALNAILAQRLVRVVCPRCAIESSPTAELLEASGIQREQAPHFHFRLGRGCGHCRGTGYKGRHAIAELLLLDDEIRELIVAEAPMRQVKEAAVRNGTRFLRERALELARSGKTTLEEINRVTFVA